MFQNLASKTAFQGFKFLSIFCFLLNNIHDFSKPLILILFSIFIILRVLKNKGGLRIKKKIIYGKGQISHKQNTNSWASLESSCSTVPQFIVRSFCNFLMLDTQATVCTFPSLASQVEYRLCLRCRVVIPVACNVSQTLIKV